MDLFSATYFKPGCTEIFEIKTIEKIKLTETEIASCDASLIDEGVFENSVFFDGLQRLLSLESTQNTRLIMQLAVILCKPLCQPLYLLILNSTQVQLETPNRKSSLLQLR